MGRGTGRIQKVQQLQKVLKENTTPKCRLLEARLEARLASQCRKGKTYSLTSPERNEAPSHFLKIPKTLASLRDRGTT